VLDCSFFILSALQTPAPLFLPLPVELIRVAAARTSAGSRANGGENLMVEGRIFIKDVLLFRLPVLRLSHVLRSSHPRPHGDQAEDVCGGNAARNFVLHGQLQMESCPSDDQV
jgi:hypothetical protein